jgi:hypothetical protein
MAKVELRNEILFTAPTRVGLLTEVTEALAAAGVNITAIGAYDKENRGEFLLMTSNNRDAGEALAPLEGRIDLVPVVMVELADEPGALAKVARRVSDAGINISQIHATTSGGPTATFIMRTDHEIKVVELLESM